jgi:Tat protein translocase TatB subunit
MPSSLGPAEILVILVVALIVLGPNKLPQAGRQLGRALSEVRRWTSDMKQEFQSVVDLDDRPTYPSSPTSSTTATAEPQPAATAATATATAAPGTAAPGGATAPPATPVPPAVELDVRAEAGSATAAAPMFAVAAEPSDAVGVVPPPAELAGPPPSPEAPQGDSAPG